MNNDSDIAYIGHGHTSKGYCRRCTTPLTVNNPNFTRDDKGILRHNCEQQKRDNKREREEAKP